jgi:hypothetical protein
VAVEATFKDDSSPSSSNGDLHSPTAAAAHRRSPDKGDGSSSTRLKFSTHTSLQPEAVAEAVSLAVSSTTGDEETTEINSGDGGPTSVQIVSQSPRRRSESSVGGGGNTEIEIFCGGEPSSSTTSIVAASPATSVAAATTPALLKSQATGKKLMDEDVAAAGGKAGEKPEVGGGSGKKGRVRAALDSVGLSAVCFYLVVWLSLFLFNAVCVCLLSVLVPCLWGGSARAGGCLLVPACPAWPATAAQFGGLPHPTLI